MNPVDYKILEGDCLEILPTLPTASVDAIVTDPPYAIPTIVASGRSNTSSIGDLSLVESVFRTIFTEFDRILKPDGRFFCFCDGTSYPVVFRAVYGRFSTALLVWDKGRLGMGREFRKSHELIMHCWRPDTPTFSDGVGRADVIQCKPVGDERLHPAQKPVHLLTELLRVCGDTVLDPFMGSGSTGVACVDTGRKFIGIEIQPEYAAVAKRRMATTQPNLLGVM
jgi:site-specific DNA-methyltransferase (adenine-specific)